MAERKEGQKVIISHSTAGEQKKLFEMCRSNAAQYLTPLTGTAGRKTAALDELAGMLGLPAAPEFIESYDISHTAGSDNVAGMIVFRNGEPYRRGYRRFMIKGFTGQDDYASMAEVLDRRFTRYEEEKRAARASAACPILFCSTAARDRFRQSSRYSKSTDLKIYRFSEWSRTAATARAR